jgi:hypothetical protein
LSTYNIGQRIRLTGTFKTVSTRALTDPTTVTLTLRSPEGEETALTYADEEIEKASTGIYYYDMTVPTTSVTGTARKWFYHFAGTGDCVATGETSFAVRSSVIS